MIRTLFVKTLLFSKIARKKADFISGMMEACYVVYNGEAVVVNAMYQTRKEIESIINELKP